MNLDKVLVTTRSRGLVNAPCTIPRDARVPHRSDYFLSL